MVWFSAFIVGICVGLLGSGGSILNIPILIYLAKESEKVAIAESLVIVGLIALFAAIPYARNHLIVWRSVLLFGIPGMVGSYIGASLSKYVSSVFQLTFLAIIMFIAAYFMFRPHQTRPYLSNRKNWKMINEGFLIGILTGLLGVGGGFLIVPSLILLGGLRIHKAVGTSLVIIAMKSSTGYLRYHDVLASLGLSFNWKLIWMFTGLGIAGSFVGSFISGKISQSTIQRVFAVSLILVGTYMLLNNIPALLVFGG